MREFHEMKQSEMEDFLRQRNLIEDLTEMGFLGDEKALKEELNERFGVDSDIVVKEPTATSVDYAHKPKQNVGVKGLRETVIDEVDVFCKEVVEQIKKTSDLNRFNYSLETYLGPIPFKIQVKVGHND